MSTTKNNPLAAVKDKFGDKKSLVSALEKLAGDELWLGRTSKEKGLAHVSNAKLLRLHATFTSVKEKFGTRAKLIEAIATIEKRTKDEGYKVHLGAFPVPRLWDLFQTLEKRGARAAKAAKTATKAKPAAKKAEKKPAAKTASKTAKKSAKK
jgi:hypothetical protein